MHLVKIHTCMYNTLLLIFKSYTYQKLLRKRKLKVHCGRKQHSQYTSCYNYKLVENLQNDVVQIRLGYRNRNIDSVKAHCRL